MDVDDTTRCPLGAECANCEATSTLTVATIDTEMGTACLTLCDTCVAAERVPQLAVGTAMRMVLEHCGHLGVSLDDMAAQRGAR